MLGKICIQSADPTQDSCARSYCIQVMRPPPGSTSYTTQIFPEIFTSSGDRSHVPTRENVPGNMYAVQHYLVISCVVALATCST